MTSFQIYLGSLGFQTPVWSSFNFFFQLFFPFWKEFPICFSCLWNASTLFCFKAPQTFCGLWNVIRLCISMRVSRWWVNFHICCSPLTHRWPITTLTKTKCKFIFISHSIASQYTKSIIHHSSDVQVFFQVIMTELRRSWAWFKKAKFTELPE